MASECDGPPTLRLSNHLRIYCDDLALPTEIGRDDVWARLESKANELRKGCSWKKMQMMLEAEAKSKVAIKELLKKLFAVSQEMSEVAAISVEEVAVLLLRLFTQEPVTSTLLKQIMEHVFGSCPSSVILYRVYQIVGDITAVLPPYTLWFLQEKEERAGHRQELFGKHIPFVPLNRDELVFPNVSELNDINLMQRASVQNGYHLVGDLGSNVVNEVHGSGKQKFSDFRFQVYQVHFRHFESTLYEEVELYPPRKKVDRLDLIMCESDDSKAVKSTVEGIDSVKDVESAVFQSVYSSDRNVLITVPLGFDKTNIVLLAVLNILGDPSESLKVHKHQLKVLYLVASNEVAEQVSKKLSNRLKFLGTVVGCFTASTHFSKDSFESTEVLVTTVNMWRDIACILGNNHTLEFFKLLVIDEMNCLQEFCGPALESIVTRITRQMKSGRRMRILGFAVSLLSANYSPAFCDMAEFLGVELGNMFVVGQRCAIVLPRVLLVKVKVKGTDEYMRTVDEFMCRTVYEAICNNKKVVVFVNSDADAVHTAKTIRDAVFDSLKHKLALSDSIKNTLLKLMTESTSEKCRCLCLDGYLVIHSEMTVGARNLICSILRKGIARFIVATSDLAWMLANQVDTVIVKEPEVYSAETGAFVGVGMSALAGMLSVACQQNTKTCQRKAVIVSGNRFEEYLTLVQNQHFVESQLSECLPDCINAEIILGNVSSIKECEEWFRCTYLYHRMRSRAIELGTDLNLDEVTQVLVSKALQVLEKTGMMLFLRAGNLKSTELGYIAYCHNISHSSMEFIGKYMNQVRTVNSILDILPKAPVFTNFQVKQDEIDELVYLEHKYCKLAAQIESSVGNYKASILLQTHLSGARAQSYGLRCAQIFVVKNMASLARAMFQVSLSKRNAGMAASCLQVAKMIEKGVWNVGNETVESLEVQIEAHIQPISRTVFQVITFVIPSFIWKAELYGVSPVQFWLWIEDSKSNFIFNHQYFRLTRKIVETKTCIELSLPVMAMDPLPEHLTVLTVCDEWLTTVQTCTLRLMEVIRPNGGYCSITGLLDLQLLPVSVLKQKALEHLYSFHCFSSEITQAFHSLYHKDCNMLLAASASKNRVTAAELAIFRAMSNKPGSKVVYLTVHNNNVKERLTDWRRRLNGFSWKILSLSGNIIEDIQTFFSADILVTTTYCWEVASRTREIRRSLQAGKVSLIILDELQVMDATVEAVVSRVRAPEIQNNVRLIGLSHTALAYANDVAHFLGIPPDSSHGIYNFGCVSGTSMTGVQVVGFTEKQYTTRMQVMSQAVWDTVQAHLQPSECVCVLVPTRRQVILTAQVLKERVLNFRNPKVWLHYQDKQNKKETCVQDLTVQEMLEHGIGLLHLGMSEVDFDIVQDQANSQKIRVMVVSWDVIGKVEVQSHLVIIKGTEQYCISMENYSDVPVPEIADKIYSCSKCWTKAFIFTQESNKALYQAYFQDTLHVESRLLDILPEYLNNEIVMQTVNSRTSALEHLSRSYLSQRLVSNPAYYLGSAFGQISEDCRLFLLDKALSSLEATGCVILGNSGKLQPTLLGLLSSSKELCHNTVKYLSTNLNSGMTQQEMFLLTCQAQEFMHVPARIHDCILIRELKKHSRWKLNCGDHSPVLVKVFFLLQCHFSALDSMFTKFVGFSLDMKEVLVFAKRVVEAMVVICSDRGWLNSALQAQLLLQMLKVGSWDDRNAAFFMLPCVSRQNLKFLLSGGQKAVRCISELHALYCNKFDALVAALREHFQLQQIKEIHNALMSLPIVNVQLSVHTDNRWWKLKQMYGKVKFGRNMVQLCAGRECTLSVELKEACGSGTWTIFLGLEQELQAMKSVSTNNHKVFLTFEAPNVTAPGKATYTLYLLSNSHIGLDQQFDLCFNITPVQRCETTHTR